MNGLKTSEFWVSVLAIIAATYLCATGKLDAGQWMIASGVSTGAYGLSRGLAKNVPPDRSV